MLIGVLVYHEVVRRGPLDGLVLLVLLLLLITSVIQLGRVESEKSPSAARSPDADAEPLESPR